jgi:hypothetical protein
MPTTFELSREDRIRPNGTEGLSFRNCQLMNNPYLVRDIVCSIGPIITPMRAPLGEGDPTATVAHQGKKTEIGQMAGTLQVFKDALIAKEAADEAAEAKIARARRNDNIARRFDSIDRRAGRFVYLSFIGMPAQPDWRACAIRLRSRSMRSLWPGRLHSEKTVRRLMP